MNAPRFASVQEVVEAFGVEGAWSFMNQTFRIPSHYGYCARAFCYYCSVTHFKTSMLDDVLVMFANNGTLERYLGETRKTA